MIHKKLTVEILRNPSLKRKFSPGACTVTDSISLLPRALPCYPTQYNLLSGGFRFFWWRSWCKPSIRPFWRKGNNIPTSSKKKHVFFFPQNLQQKCQAAPFTPWTKGLHSSHEVQIRFSGFATWKRCPKKNWFKAWRARQFSNHKGVWFL